MKKLVASLLVASMALGLTACGGSSDSTASTGESTGTAAGTEAAATAEATTTNAETNVLNINLASEPDYLDPALNSSVDGGCLAVNSFAGLYTYDKDGNLIPALATDMPEVSEDGTEYTVHMIESKWSNGDDLKASDFVYSWNRVIDEKTAADYAYLFDVIDRNDDGTLAVETPDDYTLVIKLVSPCPYFNDLLAFPTFYPVHQASVEAVPNDEFPSLTGVNPEFGILDNLGTYYIGLNVHDPVFDGKTEEEAAKMREAISLLVDRQFIVENVGQTGQIPADSFVPEGMADGNGGVFKTADTSYYDATATGAGELETAKGLLEEAGYTFTDNGDGTYAVDPAISMTYLTNDGTAHIAVAESVQQDLALLGINLEIKSEDWNVFLEDRKSGNFTIAREGWLADYNDPVNMLEIFTSDSGNNDMQLGKGTPVSSSPDWTAYDELINQIRTTTDFAARVDLMHQAEDMLMDTWAVVPIYYYNDIYMQKSNVTGIYATIFGMKYFMYATKTFRDFLRGKTWEKKTAYLVIKKL